VKGISPVARPGNSRHALVLLQHPVTVLIRSCLHQLQGSECSLISSTTRYRRTGSVSPSAF
jgi:hypothetical protein